MLDFKYLDWTNTEQVEHHSLFWLNEVYKTSDRPTKAFMDKFDEVLKRLEAFRTPDPSASLYILQVADVSPTDFLYHHIEVYECGGKLSSPVAWSGELDIDGHHVYIDAFFGNLPKKVRCLKFNADGSAADVFLNEETNVRAFYGLDAYQVSLIHRAWIK